MRDGSLMRDAQCVSNGPWSVWFLGAVWLRPPPLLFFLFLFLSLFFSFLTLLYVLILPLYARILETLSFCDLFSHYRYHLHNSLIFSHRTGPGGYRVMAIFIEQYSSTICEYWGFPCECSRNCNRIKCNISTRSRLLVSPAGDRMKLFLLIHPSVGASPDWPPDANWQSIAIHKMHGDRLC